ncbi:hypothetical protein KL921_002891 [Ogataea angusta]|uniref:NADH dehydrogenase [ubiquinone] 1 alpha subcomplex subunit n=1 Tax=Pichia angusta TaxID=870730 RepID=A0AAN6I5G8_PICAN|nr:uncharacterized protein KL928_003126 [Ogataea angusta]KAG7810396.1 hypothetical protein KL921_002891 [Ogataea angusta]KAG7818125.1 hypothetical protein KL928_003126 [Ogataea angusta]KAG7824577.1 hypothetical protein KL909_001799 [Ogataea angusta]KAG7829034.1 hypothetical protein KL920_002827 [Ogataea angusta]KAG7834167.1 hypothetical protein KL943_003463 [Ogataea angusta]
MDQINRLIPLWKQLYYKWRSLRTIPLRKKFFVGYDLTGNTYWEFFVERKKGIRPRRLYQPYKPQEFIVDYYESVPVQWLQWLRYTRLRPPSLEELVEDKMRIERIQQLAQLKDQQLQYKELQKDEAIGRSMEKALRNIKK